MFIGWIIMCIDWIIMCIDWVMFAARCFAWLLGLIV